MKTITLDELKDKTYGFVGTTQRDKLEQELKMEILSEETKRLRKESNMT